MPVRPACPDWHWVSLTGPPPLAQIDKPGDDQPRAIARGGDQLRKNEQQHQ
jgi:hypothetical protein